MMSNYMMMVNNNNNHLAVTCSVSIMGKDFVQFTKKYSIVAVLVRKDERCNFKYLVELSIFLPKCYAGKVLYLFFFFNLVLGLYSLSIMAMITINNSYS